MREPDLCNSSRHVVVTGAGGRDLDPLRERQRHKQVQQSDTNMSNFLRHTLNVYSP